MYYLNGKWNFTDVVKDFDLDQGFRLDYPGGPNVIIREEGSRRSERDLKMLCC